MGKRSRNSGGDGATRRQKVRDVYVPRPFEGLADEPQWIALREFVPAASAPLTLAPQLVGRSLSVPRLGLLEGVAFDVASAPWLHLADLRVAGDHLFTRYRNLGGSSS